MTEHLTANDHGLTYREAYSFLMFSASEAEWEGNSSLAQTLRNQGAYYKKMLTVFPEERAAQVYSPKFNNPYFTDWRKKNGITAWEEMARLSNQWNTANPSGRL